MIADIGRRLDAVIARGAGAVLEAGYSTALHVSRIVGAVSTAATTAVGKVGDEAGDLLWSYRHAVGDGRPPTRDDQGMAATGPPSAGPNNLIDIRTGKLVSRRQ